MVFSMTSLRRLYLRLSHMSHEMKMDRIFYKSCSIFRHYHLGYVIAILIVLSLLHNTLDYYGIYLMAFSVSFKHFNYPLTGDMNRIVDTVQKGKRPWVGPLNHLMYPDVSNAEERCSKGVFGDLHVILVVKSAMNHFDNRNMIRRTWGLESNDIGFRTRRVFVVGTDPMNDELQQKIHEENQAFQDIVQYYFKDTYWNNTIKLMLSMKWTEQYCSNAKFAFFLDDDYYVSNRNLKKYIHSIPASKQTNFISGYVWNWVWPLRQKNSKWFITLEEYPYDYWPPYPTAGSFLMSMATIQKFNIAMLYTKFLRFDDVFIGIVAYKLGITLIHRKDMYFYKVPYTKEAYLDVIAMHNVQSMELWKVWNEQEALKYH